MNIMTTKQAGEKWEMSSRRIAIMCAAGRIKGALKVGNSWALPADAERPQDMRIKSGKYVGWRNNK